MRDDVDIVAVTGGAGGIGLATARRFLAAGARVAVLDRSSAANEQALAALAPEHGERVLTLSCDVTDRASVDAAIAAVVERWGSIGTLVNGAGYCTFGAFEELGEDAWDQVMDVNAKGVFLCSQAVVPHMRARGSGAIVSVASQAGRQGERLIAHYCAAKAAVVNLSRAMALELAPAIRVNVVCPGVVRTPMIEGELRWRQEVRGEDPEQTLAEWRAGIPLGRFQQPDDIAQAIAFLAAAGEVTGQALSVDGGTVMV